jgi:hypothetical protein
LVRIAPNGHAKCRTFQLNQERCLSIVSKFAHQQKEYGRQIHKACLATAPKTGGKVPHAQHITQLAKPGDAGIAYLGLCYHAGHQEEAGRFRCMQPDQPI